MEYNVFAICIPFVLAVCCITGQSVDYKKIAEGDSFYFYNCNTSVVPMHFTNVQFIPNPVDLNKYFDVIVEFNLTEDLGTNHNFIEVDLDLNIKTDRGYTALCEIIGEHKCHLDDLCVFLENNVDKKNCPDIFVKKYNNKCRCPFKQGTYNIFAPVPAIRLAFELRGTFSVQVSLEDKGKLLGCLDVQFCIT